MDANADFRSDIEMWADMWDEMEQDGRYPAAEAPRAVAGPVGDTAQDDYFDLLDDLDGGEALLQEEHSPNPVYPDSVGMDQKQPKPVWVSEDLLKEVEALKERLFKLENKAARLGQGDKLAAGKTHGMFEKDMFAEIKELRGRIDRVSSQLGVADEPSPWELDKVRQQRHLKSEARRATR